MTCLDDVLFSLSLVILRLVWMRAMLYLAGWSTISYSGFFQCRLTLKVYDHYGDFHEHDLNGTKWNQTWHWTELYLT